MSWQQNMAKSNIDIQSLFINRIPTSSEVYENRELEQDFHPVLSLY